MHWVAPSDKDAATDTLEKHLRESVDQFRANSGLKAQEYSGSILGMAFLRFAEVRFAGQCVKLENSTRSFRGRSRTEELAAHYAKRTPYLAPDATFDFLPSLPLTAAIGAKSKAVMIEAQGWSVNPSRYIGSAQGTTVSDEGFKELLEILKEEVEILEAL